MMHYIDDHLVRIFWIVACFVGSVVWAIVGML